MSKADEIFKDLGYELEDVGCLMAIRFFDMFAGIIQIYANKKF